MKTRFFIGGCLAFSMPGFMAMNAARAENGCPAGYEPWKIPVESPSDCVAIPNYYDSDQPQAPRPQALPPQWYPFAAAVAWADSDNGSQYIGVQKYLDEPFAREAALEKCREQKGWRNCEIATSITNGVIVIARDENRSLRTRLDASEKEARTALLKKCEVDGVTCKILKIYDGRPEYF